MTIGEFDIIEKFFKKQSVSRDDVVLNIGDDCAILDIPTDQQLAITMDTLVAGVHFPINTPAYDIGYKSLAVNLSDLAAMGATPAWITLALTLHNANEKWLTEFSRGVFDLAKQHNVQLIGGDLTHGPLTITIQAHGFVPKGQALKRSSAKSGDLIFVTNTLGDAALGLAIAQNKISAPKLFEEYLLKRLNRPEPQVTIGQQLLGIAHAAIDISDGLAADLRHILDSSNVGATLFVDDLPLSPALRESVSPREALHFALTGGDDYELCFTVAKDKEDLFKNHFTCIGVITEKPGLDLRYKDGSTYNDPIDGYLHFS